MEEKTLVLIKPDAMIKKLAGNIISELYNLDLKMIGLKLVDVQKELAEKHYEEHKEKPFFQELIEHITGKLHEDENVIAIVYSGEDAISKVRKLVGKTNPDESIPHTLRGKYGKINSKTNCHETVIHASDSIENAKKEIELWFKKDELVK
ncbi:MAG: nucleoside-diphosphate kinase [Candidatus Pacearchaeota archaeon]|jgi:nucleoside-diphosphate kinase|nr:nucleoside-diphosphate kinase [Candidatus Pacearchaeota archaeon]MDP7520751.1 nucleoside-diphosphate kinase [Candidatus Pacearchaeota archaeon]|tara:strand:- start:44174 stop:44623 length:450 start_codon:yes stop_codon:yes gene_type:complete